MDIEPEQLVEMDMKSVPEAHLYIWDRDRAPVHVIFSGYSMTFVLVNAVRIE